MSTDILDSLIDTHLPAAARGDRDAYGRIVAGCQSTVTSIALAIVRDVPASEDIAQEAFLSAWQNLRKLNNRASFLPWLRQITRNLARDHLRAHGLRANPAADIDALIANLADPQPGPDERLDDDQARAVAASVIDALPEESREVLLLYYREGQSSRQVASLLGLQDAAVRKRLSRAREKVRAELLARLGAFARATAPGAGFTAAVAALLIVGAPPAAAATALGAGALGAASGLAKIGTGALAGAFAGVVGGLWGVWFGVGKLLRDPHDARERRGVVAYALTTSALVVAFSVAIVWVARLPGWIPHLAVTVAFALGMVLACGVWFPRIVARRLAHERATDPTAAERQRRARAWGRVGAAAGLLLGTGGLVLGLWLSGRMG
ncbi:MAG TPA: sigma-70 family RNA polymerase sigma factor [Arenimonas sp.]|uniref:RNA polymerase sigma factor n=1 Tax=Arenimonas sp. TaxID=1872635 RepID=UPI002D809E10|nr:sigma-70 family RNA polymerase sigma factor [Arenimonas sp.]HEU0153105.1 sigma-70 family RNA polymerase sigma factor [Arenimonas sp.]